MGKEQKYTLSEMIADDLDNVLDCLFVKFHTMKGTTAGDITPKQQFKLDALKNELVALITQQIEQNSIESKID